MTNKKVWYAVLGVILLMYAVGLRTFAEPERVDVFLVSALGASLLIASADTNR